MDQVTPQRLAMAEERRARAQYRRDKVANLLWELYGYGEHYKIKRAEAGVESANKELRLAEQALEKLQKLYEKQQAASKPA